MSEQKLWALLVPTPLQHIDPDGEDARVDRVKSLLGLEPTEEEEAARVLAAQKAADAQFIDAQFISDRQAQDPRRCLHPLSAEPLQPNNTPLDELQTEWNALLEEIRKKAPAYPKQWRLFVRSPLTTSLPSDPRMPDVPVWSHRSLTAAFIGAGDSPALMMTHLGPVGRFIKAARRTSDLWLGSYLVAYLTLHMAKAVIKELGPEAVISPFLGDLPLADVIVFGDDPPKFDPEDVFPNLKLLSAALPNKLVVLVDGEEAKKVAKEAAKAAREKWIALGEGAIEWIRKQLGDDYDLIKNQLTKQLKEHLELDALIQPWPQNRKAIRTLLQNRSAAPDLKLPGDDRSLKTTGDAYGLLFDLTHRSMTAARLTRGPLAWEGDQRPKCSQTGRREQLGPITAKSWKQQSESRTFWKGLSEALQKSQSDKNDEVRYTLHLPQGDGLGGVAFTKRFAAMVLFDQHSPAGLNWNDSKQRKYLRFPSTPSIAAAPFRRRLHESPSNLRKWLDALAKLHKQGLGFEPPGNLFPELIRLQRTDKLFKFDGAWVYPEAYEPQRAFRDHFGRPPEATDQDRLKKIKKQSAEALKQLQALYKAIEYRPSMYYAVISIDGDDMGQWLTGRHKKTPTMREITQSNDDRKRPLFPALHGELSRRLTKLAANDIPTIIDQHLGRTVYSGGDDVLALVPIESVIQCLQALDKTLRSPKAMGSRLTFSAGVAIAHQRLPLSQAIERAQKGEKTAKAAQRIVDGQGWVHFSLVARAGAKMEWTLPRWIQKTDMLGFFYDLSTDAVEGERRMSLNVAHTLRSELPALRGENLAPFYARMKYLLGDQLIGSLRRIGDVLPKVYATDKLQDNLANMLLGARFFARELPEDSMNWLREVDQ